MRLLMFSIKDTKTHVFLVPFPARSDVDAMRNISADFRNPQIKETPIGQNPKDFDLFCVAAFDDETGVIEGTLPRFVANIGDLASSTVPS